MGFKRKYSIKTEGEKLDRLMDARKLKTRSWGLANRLEHVRNRNKQVRKLKRSK